MPLDFLAVTKKGKLGIVIPLEYSLIHVVFLVTCTV